MVRILWIEESDTIQHSLERLAQLPELGEIRSIPRRRRLCGPEGPASTKTDLPGGKQNGLRQVERSMGRGGWDLAAVGNESQILIREPEVLWSEHKGRPRDRRFVLQSFRKIRQTEQVIAVGPAPGGERYGTLAPIQTGNQALRYSSLIQQLSGTRCEHSRFVVLR